MFDENILEHKYYMVNKPYDMLSQFIKNEQANRLLSELNYTFPAGTHAIGRLDNLSEGLLLLTTDKSITKLLFESKRPHKRRYLVQVTHQVTDETLHTLRTGVEIFVKGAQFYVTKPCHVEIVNGDDYKFSNGFKPHEKAAHTWLLITLTEGKFHQVRKMVFALKHRCKRLIRLSIEDMNLGDLKPGEVHEFTKNEFFNLLNLT